MKQKFFYALTLLAAWSAAAQPKRPDLLAVVQHSSFVFTGTILKLQASTPSIPRENGTAVVRVDEIIDATPDLRSLQGKEVTVRLLRPNATRAGAQRIFYTEPYSYGRTLGVTEVASEEPRERGATRREVANARQQLRDRALAARIRSAERIVVARVVEVRPAPEMERAAREEASEHNPLWHIARLAVSETLKGERSAEAVVRFAASRDVMWFGTPKLAVGQQVIVLMQPNPIKEFPTRGPIVIDPLDVQELSQRERVGLLLRAQQ
ncbi:MAG TPA: hypothetical protein VF824_06815 [Thermoanaerobaculia bacterium]|jgi:hypothetical protein